MDTGEKEVLCSKFSVIPITAGKVYSKMYEPYKDKKNFKIWFWKVLFQLHLIVLTNTCELRAIKIKLRNHVLFE